MLLINLVDLRSAHRTVGQSRLSPPQKKHTINLVLRSLLSKEVRILLLWSRGEVGWGP